jgi:hypothetical protein
MLYGHPLAMQVVLWQLEKGTLSPSDLIDWLRKNFSKLKLDESGEVEQDLVSSFVSLEGLLSERSRVLLVPLGLHEGFVAESHLAEIAMLTMPDGKDITAEFVRCLEQAGFIHESENGLFEIHPLLVGYIRSRAERLAEASLRHALKRAFVDVIGEYAQTVSLSEPDRRVLTLQRHEAIFHQALITAEELRMTDRATSLMQLLAQHAY